MRRLWPEALAGKFPKKGVSVRLHVLLGEGKEGMEGKEREQGEGGKEGEKGKEGGVGKEGKHGKGGGRRAGGSGKGAPQRGLAEQRCEGECKEFSVELVVWHQVKDGSGGGSGKKRCRGDGDNGASAADCTTSAAAATSTGASARTGGRYWALTGAEELLAALGAYAGSHVSLTRLPDGRALVRRWDEQEGKGATWQEADFVPPPPPVPVFKVRVSNSAVYVSCAAVRELWPQACDLEPGSAWKWSSLPCLAAAGMHKGQGLCSPAASRVCKATGRTPILRAPSWPVVASRCLLAARRPHGPVRGGTRALRRRRRSATAALTAVSFSARQPQRHYRVLVRRRTLHRLVV